MTDFFNNLQDKPIEVIAVICSTLIILAGLAVLWRGLGFLIETSKNQASIAENQKESLRLNKELLQLQKDEREQRAVWHKELQDRVGNLSKMGETQLDAIDTAKKKMLAELRETNTKLQEGFNATGVLITSFREQVGADSFQIREDITLLKEFVQGENDKILQRFSDLLKAAEEKENTDFEHLKTAFIEGVQASQNMVNRLAGLIGYASDTGQFKVIDTLPAIESSEPPKNDNQPITSEINTSHSDDQNSENVVNTISE